MGCCKSNRGSTTKGPDVEVLNKQKPVLVKTPESAFIIHFLKK